MMNDQHHEGGEYYPVDVVPNSYKADFKRHVACYTLDPGSPDRDTYRWILIIEGERCTHESRHESPEQCERVAEIVIAAIRGQDQ